MKKATKRNKNFAIIYFSQKLPHSTSHTIIPEIVSRKNGERQLREIVKRIIRKIPLDKISVSISPSNKELDNASIINQENYMAISNI